MYILTYFLVLLTVQYYSYADLHVLVSFFFSHVFSCLMPLEQDNLCGVFLHYTQLIEYKKLIYFIKMKTNYRQRSRIHAPISYWLCVTFSFMCQFPKS